MRLFYDIAHLLVIRSKVCNLFAYARMITNHGPIKTLSTSSLPTFVLDDSYMERCHSTYTPVCT